MNWKVIDKLFRPDRIFCPLIYILEKSGHRQSFFSDNECIITGDKVKIKRSNKGEYLEVIKWKKLK